MYRDSFVNLERLSGVHWDIVEMARRMAEELREHWFDTDDSETDIYYLVGHRPDSGIDKWHGEDDQPCLFKDAMRFESEEHAMSYMSERNLPYTAIHQIDTTQAEIVTGFTYEISNAHISYKNGKICQWCNNNAATKITFKKSKTRTTKEDAYVPCRSCSIGHVNQVDSTDFLGRNSPLAALQELEGPPRFTAEDFAKVSRAAAKCGILPTIGYGGKI